MSVLFSDDVQSAIYAALIASTAPTLSAQSVFDAAPVGALPDCYALIGEERVKNASDKTHLSYIHEIKISVLSSAAGFQKAKMMSSEIVASLADNALVLSEGSICKLQFLSARSALVRSEDQRKIILNFRAFIDAS